MTFMTASTKAILSSDKLYRYWLEKDFHRPGLVGAFIGVNPSKAETNIDDPTSTKIWGFSERMGFSRTIIGNKFAYRATDVRELKTVTKPTGPENFKYLERLMTEADIVIVAWGALAKLPPPLRIQYHSILAIARDQSKFLHCLGVANDGHPRHPLMLPYTTRLEAWRNDP